MTETATEVNLQGYRIKVAGIYVTEMRVFRNQLAEEAIINLQDSIIFDESVNPQSVITSLRNTGIWDGGDPKKTAQVEFFDIIIDKETGAVTESSQGTHNFPDVVNGIYGNFVPSVIQASGLLLSSKFLRGGTYFLGKNAIDVISIYGTGSVVFKDMTGATITTVAISAYKVVNVDIAAHGFSNMDYQVTATIGGGTVLDFYIKKSTKIDGSNSAINDGSTTATPDKYCADQVDNIGNPTSSEGGGSAVGGTNSVFYGDPYYNIIFEHPWGGWDCTGTCNMTSASGSSQRNVLSLDRKAWKRTSIGNPHLSSQQPNEFSTSDNVNASVGTTSMSFEMFTETIDELWLSAVSASKRAFLSSSRNSVFGVIQGVIEGISASYEEYQDGYKAWRVTFSFVQTVGFHG